MLDSMRSHSYSGARLSVLIGNACVAIICKLSDLSLSHLNDCIEELRGGKWVPTFLAVSSLEVADMSTFLNGSHYDLGVQQTLGSW